MAEEIRERQDRLFFMLQERKLMNLVENGFVKCYPYITKLVII